MKKSIIAFVLTLCLLISFPFASGAAAFPASIGIIEAQAASVKINKTKLTLIKGQTYTLKISGTKKTVKWSSSKKSVASVSSKGKVTAKKKGTATISAKVAGKTYKCKITVETPSISKTKADLAIGKTTTLSIKNTSQKVSWKSSDSKIATVDSKGKVKGIKKGSATITATVGSLKKKYTCKVKVNTKKAVEFAKLEAVIEKKGFKDSNGKYLKDEFSDDDSGDYFNYDIRITDDVLSLMLIRDTEESGSRVVKITLPKNSSTATAYYSRYESSDDLQPSLSAMGQFDSTAYNENETVIDFAFIPSEQKSDATNNYANSQVKELLLYVQQDILKGYGISLNNLGFTKFNK